MKSFKNISRRLDSWWYYLNEENKEAVIFCLQVIAISVMAFFILSAIFFAAVEYEQYLSNIK